jgi:SAM-dependent methyltransferase
LTFDRTRYKIAGKMASHKPRPRSGEPQATASLDDFVGNPQWYEAEEWTRPDEMAMFTNVWGDVRRHLDTRRGATLLDLCCGTGMSLLGAVSHLSLDRFIGVDVEDRAVTFARQRFSGFPACAFYCGDAATFHLADHGHPDADVIILSSAYHHMPDDRKIDFLGNVAFNLAAGGRVIVAENILPAYDANEASYMAAVRRFYSGVVRTVMDAFPATSRELLVLIESNITLAAAKREEFKVSMPVFLSHVDAANLVVHHVRQVWSSPEEPSASWGNFVFELGHPAGRS